MGFVSIEARTVTMVFATTLLITPIAAQSIAGTVKDRTTGAAVAEASLILMSDDNRIQRGTLSETNGTFLLEAPAAGTYVLRVGAAGYLTSDIRDFTIREEQADQLEILLTADPSVSGAPSGFFERMARGSGEFITRQQVEDGAFTFFTELLQDVSAVRVVPLSATSRVNAAVDELALLPVLKRRSSLDKSRESFEVAIGGRSHLSTVRIKTGRDLTQQGEPADDCVPVLWVDGLWWGGIDTASPTGPDGAFVPADILGIEIYDRPSILPDQFDSGRETLCGVVVVWTKWEN